VFVDASYVRVPVSAALRTPASHGNTWKVDAVMVAGSIGSLNVTRTCAFVAMSVARFAGFLETIVGAVTSGAAVVKLELKGVAPLPATSVAPLVTLTV
jgi:hypothetical protein